MKLRIQDSAIRLRLSPSEVAQLASTGRVASAAHFGAGCTLTYAVETEFHDGLRAEFRDGALTVFVPRAWVAPWTNSERVGFEAVQDVGSGRTLSLLVEKDFDCLHKPSPGAAFPHPLAETQADGD